MFSKKNTQISVLVFSQKQCNSKQLAAVNKFQAIFNLTDDRVHFKMVFQI